VTLIAGGKSNLTFRVDAPAGSVILRRPPLGHVLPTGPRHGARAHGHVGAGGNAVPVPRMLHLCTDAEVLGQPFYVMERVEGHVCREALPARLRRTRPSSDAPWARGWSRCWPRCTPSIPPRSRLDGFGRPDGYLERQVRRWVKQWDATRIEGTTRWTRLAADLAAQVPATQRHTVVHGDYRLDNTMLHLTEPGRIAAVLDWEMSTLGDPLADLGILLGYWSQADDSGARTSAAVVPAATVLEGFPPAARSRSSTPRAPVST
jgi:aminoglycoside phosphotransferase (APT) family kinase protein